MQPDPAFTFTELDQATEEYVVLHGTFDSGPAQPDGKNTKSSTGTAQFTGAILTPDGFQDGITTEVAIVLECAGQWCAGFKPKTPYLAFVQKTDAKPQLNIGPCYMTVFSPSEATLEIVKQCAAGGPCNPV